MIKRKKKQRRQLLHSFLVINNHPMFKNLPVFLLFRSFILPNILKDYSLKLPCMFYFVLKMLFVLPLTFCKYERTSLISTTTRKDKDNT